MALQIDLLPQVKKYKEAWTSYENWEINSQRGGESAGLLPALKYMGGEAALECARNLNAEDPDEGWLRRQYLKRAKELLALGAAAPGEFRLPARLKLGDPLLVAGAAFGQAPKTYAEARDLGRIAWNQLRQPGLKAPQRKRLCDEGKRYFGYALAHAPSDVKIDELNGLRYCLAYLDWLHGDCYDAVVLGEFLAQRYAQRPEAEGAAHVALFAHLRLWSEATTDEGRSFESRRAAALAERITRRWPQGTTADDAWMVLARAAASRRDLDQTAACLAHIDAQSPRRGDAELGVGQALWSACLEAARLAPRSSNPLKTTMRKMASQSRQLLEDGVARLAGRSTPAAKHP